MALGNIYSHINLTMEKAGQRKTQQYYNIIYIKPLNVIHFIISLLKLSTHIFKHGYKNMDIDVTVT